MPARRGKNNPFQIQDIRNFWNDGLAPRFNESRHEDDTKSKRMVWNSGASISTGEQTGFTPNHGGQLVSVRGEARNGGPSGGDLEFDVLLNGFSIFDAGYATILDGETLGLRKPSLKRIYFTPDEMFSIDVQDAAGATGPLVVAIEFVEA